MQRQIYIGLFAGLLAMMAFAAAATSPSALLLILALFTPLPIFIAGLSAGWFAAAIAGLTGAIAMAIISNPLAGIIFAATQLLPAAVLCYFALLFRESSAPVTKARSISIQHKPNSNDDTREWYPLGWIVIWATAFAILLSIATLLIVAQDIDALKTMLREHLDKLIDAQIPQDSPAETTKTISESDREYMAQVTLFLLPAATTITILSSLLLNLWLAGRITRAFNSLSRPWPDIAAITYPSGTPLVLTAGLLAAWTFTGLPGLAASALAGGLFFAYVLLGLAVIHHVTRGLEWRSFALVGIYLALIIFNSGFLILIALVGLAEPISPLRRDFISNSDNSPNNDN